MDKKEYITHEVDIAARRKTAKWPVKVFASSRETT